MTVWLVGCLLALLVLGAFPLTVCGETTNLLPNPSFEAGEGAPAQWAVSSGGVGRWEEEGHEGVHSVSVTGKGGDSVYWFAAGYLAVKPRSVYHASFWARRSSGGAWGIISGLSAINRDFAVGSEWERKDFFFRTPDKLGEALFRLGEWHHDGTIWLDDVSLTPALALYSQPEGLGVPLGDGESVKAGRYQAVHHMAGTGANDHRCLERFSAQFNTNRWVFLKDCEVVYRHRVGRLRQKDATVGISVNYHQGGKLSVEASRDGRAWVRLGEIEKVNQVEFPVPLRPGREVWVRLRTIGPADLQVDGYCFRSTLEEAQWVERAVGATRHVGIRQCAPDLTVSLPEAVFRPTGEHRVTVKVQSEVRRRIEVSFVMEQRGKVVAHAEARELVAPGRSATAKLSSTVAASGDYLLRLQCRETRTQRVLWEAEGRMQIPVLYDASGGELLVEDDALSIWWCEPERKVSRTRPAPASKSEGVRISAAGNEYEAAQLVITPRLPVAGCRVSIGDLTGLKGAQIPASEVTVRLVEYVFTETPTDELGTVEEWPDPLPLARAPVGLREGWNQPFWITVHVPAGTPPGDYRGTISVSAGGISRAIPLVVHVWDFDLPRETHVRSGFGLNVGELRRYHNLETEDEVRQVHELYLQDFAKHRVCPYDFGRGTEVTWEQDIAGEAIPRLDFTGFDADAHYALDQLGFNAFTLHLEGMGGGTFHERYLGEIAGHKQGTAEYERAFTRYVRAVQDHLEQKGWLDKAYIYWFDEPSEEDTQFVKEGMELIGRAGPKLTRLLTTAPRAALYGKVELWCQPTHTLDPATVQERKAAGEEMWWYLCCAPKAPHFTLFLDHHGTEIRLWLWETWKYGYDGILVWATNYWTSPTAYPRPALQNPWQDPMSWVSGYGTPRGAKQPWGNGDGRFFYPPTRDPENDKTKYLEGPTPSIRWELLRDGIEDYEYFWLLKAELERYRAGTPEPADLAQFEQLLVVPADVCTSPTQFTTTPEPIHTHREKLARAIEELRER